MDIELFVLTSLNERMLSDVSIEPATFCIPGGRASDRANVPGFVILWFRTTFRWKFSSHFSHALHELYANCAISWRLYPNHSIRSKCRIEKKPKHESYTRKMVLSCKPQHDKTNNMACAPSEDSDQLCIRPASSESSMCAQWVAREPRFLRVDSEDSDLSSLGALIFSLVLSSAGSCHNLFPWYDLTGLISGIFQEFR